ncbi:capsular biosynthesis protein [Janthinobacterium sp. 17J80-10]|nr:capsular biosynthesis protein [Janthinobacterium sp. 17J80-10]
MLQGPLGPFFRRLAGDIEWAGGQVCKVNFNGGDWLFSPSGAINFRGHMEDWPAFLTRLLTERKIDMVLLFGDCRPIHRVTQAIAAARRIEIGVFEEGYVRPDYITLERFGVNGHSKIPRSPVFYLNTPEARRPPTQVVGPTFRYVVMWAMLYYLASALLRPVFPHYRHHRPLSIMEAWPWIRSGWRKAIYRRREAGIQTELATTYSKRYFLVPLQVHNDAQVHVHSDFESVEAFIATTLISFADKAPKDTILVIKHHPMDRGYHDHTRLIAHLEKKLEIIGRVRYLHDQHLPTLLEHARGVVVINSTVGLSALHHGTPLKVCGTALYNMKGLSFQGSLDDFWLHAHQQQVDMALYHRFRNYLIRYTQVNGNFYKRLDIAGSDAGIVWSSAEVAETNTIIVIDEQAARQATAEISANKQAS